MPSGNPRGLALSFPQPDLRLPPSGVTTVNLSLDKEIKYSPLERKLFSALQRRPLSTVDLTEVVYTRQRRPFNARQSVLGALNSLSRKVKKNKEPFEVKRSTRQGPHPVNFWIEK